MMPTEKRGILRDIRGVDTALNLNGITDIQTTIKPGEMMEPLPKGGRYLGFLFAEGTDRDTVIKILKEAWSKITVVSEKI